MSFTYDPTLATQRDQIRFELGDTQAAPAGILPNGANVPDETIDALIEQLGDKDHVIFNIAHQASAAWSKVPTSYNADGQSISRSDGSANWLNFARQKLTERQTFASKTSDAGFGTVDLSLDGAGDNNDVTDEFARRTKLYRRASQSYSSKWH